jgi:8-oxo-dGTP pyrophosphatase MutT (NUDIX family)
MIENRKMDMPRTTRYQAAIIRGEDILLIKNREHGNGRAYWLLPGGGIEAGETEIECVQREAHEETNLEVKVEGLLLDEPPQYDDGGIYQRFKTYLCRPITNEASPGFEPGAAAICAIVEVGWYKINDETTWDELIVNDPITAPALRRIRTALEKVNANSVGSG